MRFSVLMSIYKNDNPSFLEIALESIYEKQTLKPNEIVLVFDGKLTDELYNVVDNFKKDKEHILKVVKLERNQGLGNALREGSKYCTSEYIMRMDSDDISAPNRFEVQMKYALDNTNIDCFGTYIAEFKETLHEKMRVRVVPEKQNEIVRMAKRRNSMNHVSVCIKRDALEKSGGYEEVKLLEDYYLWLKMIVAGCELRNIPESLVYVRVGNGFDNKRGSKERIVGWGKLQKYMLKNNLINIVNAINNMLSIVVFVYLPPNIKKVIYNVFLRKNVEA